MMMIRLAKEADFKAILGLIKEFHGESIDSYGLFCNDDIALSIMPRYLGRSLVMEKDGELIGVIAGLVTNYPLSDETVFQEQLWYVKKQYRSASVKFFEAMEDYCRITLKVKKIVMCGFGEERRQTKDRFFRKRGYRVLETHYIKQTGGQDD